MVPNCHKWVLSPGMRRYQVLVSNHHPSTSWVGPSLPLHSHGQGGTKGLTPSHGGLLCPPGCSTTVPAAEDSPQGSFWQSQSNRSPLLTQAALATQMFISPGRPVISGEMSYPDSWGMLALPEEGPGWIQPLDISTSSGNTCM